LENPFRQILLTRPSSIGRITEEILGGDPIDWCPDHYYGGATRIEVLYQ